MILDIARHKFHEGIITLLLITAATLLAADSLSCGIAPTAPLARAIDTFAREHGAWSMVLAALMMLTCAMNLTRATLRSGIYTFNTMATMSLTALMLAVATCHEGMLLSLVAATLACEAVARILRSRRGSHQLHYTFTAMLAVGCMPLVDSALLVVVIMAMLLVVFATRTLRRTIIAYAGLLLPIAIYGYVCWCKGEGFVQSIVALWDMMLMPTTQPITYDMEHPHLVFASIMLFATLLGLIYRHTQSAAVQHNTRYTLDVLFAMAIVLAAIFAMLPSAGSTSLVAVGAMMLPITPLFFQYAPILLAIATYVAMLISAGFVLVG